MVTRRERYRARLAEMTTAEMDARYADSIAAIKTQMETSRPIPSRFFCNTCSKESALFIPTRQLDDLREWAEKADRPDVLAIVSEGISDWLRCRCERLAETQKTKSRASSLPNRGDEAGPRTFDNFEIVVGSEESYEAAKAFGAGPPLFLMLIGVTGCGKSHLLEAAGRSLLAAGRGVRYERTGNMLDRLRASQGRNSDENLYDLVAWYSEREVLLLDELALESDRPTDFGVGELTTIIDNRIVNTRHTLITTNVTTPTALIDRGWGERLASRLFDINTGAIRIVWSKAPDYRRAKQ